MSARVGLVVGLGNPGLAYAGTRHNVGFMVLDRRAAILGFRFKKEGRAEVARRDGVYYLKPMTFMNLSGEAVGPFCRRHAIEARAVLVVVDDMDLPPGDLRIRRGGSSGGHNGLQSLIAALGTDQFPRLKVGIGRPPADEDPVRWVLGRWPRTDRQWWQGRIIKAHEAIGTILQEGLDVAMNRYNQRG